MNYPLLSSDTTDFEHSILSRDSAIAGYSTYPTFTLELCETYLDPNKGLSLASYFNFDTTLSYGKVCLHREPPDSCFYILK